MTTYFAHAGEQHQSTNAAGISLPPDAVVGLALFAAIVLLWTATTLILKTTLATRILLIMVVLLFTGIFSYQAAPIVSIVALSSGILLALVVTLVQLMATKLPQAED